MKAAMRWGPAFKAHSIRLVSYDINSDLSARTTWRTKAHHAASRARAY